MRIDFVSRSNAVALASWFSVCLVALFVAPHQSSFGQSFSSMSVVAPGTVTDLGRVEARVSIRNPTTSAKNYSLELYRETSLGIETIATTNIAVAGNGQQLFSNWIPSAGHAGLNTIRYRITASGEAEMSGQETFQVIASDTRAAPLITTAWIDPGAVLSGVYPQARPVTAQDVRNKIDAAHAVGIDTLVITYPEYILNGWGAFYPSQYYANQAGFDVVGTILNQASENGQKVFVGLGRGDDLYLTWNGFNDPERISAALEHGTNIATELWDLYSDEASFYGWYLTHEANDIQQASDAYYNAMTDILRGFEADKPVMVSPAGTPIISSQILSNSHVDIFAYQDAVGSGYVPYVNTFDPQQRIDTLNAVFSAYQNSHAGTDKHLWANLENWQMDGPIYGNAYPADIARVLQQLAIEKNYVDSISSYELLGFMEHPDSTVVLGGQKAVDLYVGYRDYYQQVSQSLKTTNYVTNAGFEEGVEPDSITPAGWQFLGDDVDQRVSFSDDTPSGSETSVSLEVDTADGLPWLVQDVPVVEGEEYKFSAYVKELQADPSNGWLAAQVWMLSDADSGSILDSTAILFSDANWALQSSFITAPAGATIARLIFAIQDSAFGVGTGHYLIDGVSLVGPGLSFESDFDADGDVDGDDFLIWQANFGTPAGATSATGDADGDGDVDGDDFLSWQSQFGSGGNAAQTAVPEPSSRLIGALILACFVSLRVTRSLGPVKSLSTFTVLMLAAQVSFANETKSESSNSTPSFSSSMTLTPAVHVSEHVEVEMRVAVRNHTNKDARFELVLSVDSADGKTRPLIGTPLEVPALGQKLFTHRVPTAELLGQNRFNYRIGGPDGFEESGDWSLTVVSSESRAVPLLQIGWIDPGAMIPKAYPQKQPPTEQDLRDAIDRYHAIGVSGLIITYPESIYLGSGVFFPTRVFRDDGAPVSFDVVGTILNQASRNDQHVFVGLGRGPDLLLTWTGFDDAARNERALAHSMKMATELWALYGHEPSFYGWYLSHEANDIARASKSYYNPITRFLRTFEADKPVLISPSGTPILSPEALAESEVDIFAYQDAVGSGYVPFENTFDPQRRIDMLPEVFEEYARAHRNSGKHLWANLEIWEMDGPEYGASHPPEFGRVLRQLEIEKQYVDVITTYTLSGFIESPESRIELGGPKAVQLFNAYRAYYQKVAKRLLVGSPAPSPPR